MENWRCFRNIALIFSFCMVFVGRNILQPNFAHLPRRRNVSVVGVLCRIFLGNGSIVGVHYCCRVEGVCDFTVSSHRDSLWSWKFENFSSLEILMFSLNHLPIISMSSSSKLPAPYLIPSYLNNLFNPKLPAQVIKQIRAYKTNVVRVPGNSGLEANGSVFKYL